MTKTERKRREKCGGARPRQTIHCVVHQEAEAYIGECIEFGVLTQGRTLDEVVANVRDALVLHLEDEDLKALGFAAQPRV